METTTISMACGWLLHGVVFSEAGEEWRLLLYRWHAIGHYMGVFFSAEEDE